MALTHLLDPHLPPLDASCHQCRARLRPTSGHHAAKPRLRNPASLVIEALYGYTSIYGRHFIIGTAVGAHYRGTCYIQMSGPTKVILYDTESGNLVEAGMGKLGTAATLAPSRCSVYLVASSLSGDLYSLRISSTAPNGISLPVFAQYIAGNCQENFETFANLGSWTVQAGAPPPVQPAVLTSPTPSSTLPGAGATFAWTAGSGVSNYALQVGTYPGANNISNQRTFFLRSCTGAVALNRPGQMVVQDNSFTHNYKSPYDSAGGTMNTTECDYDTKILGNVFSGTGLNLGSGYSTQALELHGHKELIQNNTIRGYPYSAILARSTKDLVIGSGNVLEGNGRASDNDESGIDIWNVVSNRVTSGVVIQGNTVSNNSPSTAVPGRLPFAVRFSQHDCGGAGAPPVDNCAETTDLIVITNVQVTSNQFNNMLSAGYCVMNNVMAPTGWSLQSGWMSCGI